MPLPHTLHTHMRPPALTRRNTTHRLCQPRMKIQRTNHNTTKINIYRVPTNLITSLIPNPTRSKVNKAFRPNTMRLEVEVESMNRPRTRMISRYASIPANMVRR